MGPHLTPSPDTFAGRTGQQSDPTPAHTGHNTKQEVITMLKHRIAAVILLAAVAAPTTAAQLDRSADHIRPRAAVVVEVSADTVTARDTAGFLWSFAGAEDWQTGDGCNLLLNDNGTPEISDDKIISAPSPRWQRLLCWNI